MSSPILEISSLEYRYESGTHAVRGISMHIAAGEVVALLGPNGAGKTTTVDIISGFRHASAGTISVLGLNPANRRDLQQLRRKVGIVLQQTAHHRFLTVRETLEMHASYYDSPRSIDHVLELVGLEDCASKSVRRTSGGQQRRLDVGVALVGHPELLVLDEPTTGFDPQARQHFWRMISSLQSSGTTILLTTHYMEEAQALADRVVVMHSGTIASAGTARELASELKLNTRISFALPPNISADQLPAGTGMDGGWHLESTRASLTTDQAVLALAALTQWALDGGFDLPDLEVRSPSLEDSYLALIERGQHPTDTKASVTA